MIDKTHFVGENDPRMALIFHFLLSGFISFSLINLAETESPGLIDFFLRQGHCVII